MIRIAHAAATEGEFAAQCLVNKINQVILFPLITLLMALAFLVFLYGCFEYVRKSSSDQGREQGKQHILWGVIGMFIMLSAYSILSLAAGTFGIGLFNADSIGCDASSPVAQTTAPTIGGIVGNSGLDIRTPDSPFGGAVVPGQDDPPVMPPPPLPPALPDTIAVDTLPEVDTSLPPCPPRESRVDGECTTMYPFEIRNDSQIEVSCIGDPTCIGAIAACENRYGGVMNTVNNIGGYVLCDDSNFSTGPANTVTYSNPPEGLFESPPGIAAYTPGISTPPQIEAFEGWTAFSGTNTFVSPEFEDNFDTYVEPYVREDNADEQAIIDEYAQYGVSQVLFMVSQVETQQGGTMSQVEARCEDLNGELTLESGPSRVTSVSTYACLQ